MSARQSLYESERERHRANDVMCKEFAALVQPFSEKVAKLIAAAIDTSASEEVQLEHIVKAQEDAPSVVLDFAAASELEKKIQGNGVTINPHTSLSVEDVKAQWENFTAVRLSTSIHPSISLFLSLSLPLTPSLCFPLFKFFCLFLLLFSHLLM